MSQPLPYERDFDFEGFQSGHPSTPLPGDKVNLEFDQVAETFDQVLDRIARLQRDDLELANQSVGLDQLKPEISFGAGAASAAAASAATATAAASATTAQALAAAASADAAAQAALSAEGGAAGAVLLSEIAVTSFPAWMKALSVKTYQDAAGEREIIELVRVTGTPSPVKVGHLTDLNGGYWRINAKAAKPQFFADMNGDAAGIRAALQSALDMAVAFPGMTGGRVEFCDGTFDMTDVTLTISGKTILSANPGGCILQRSVNVGAAGYDVVRPPVLSATAVDHIRISGIRVDFTAGATTVPATNSSNFSPFFFNGCNDIRVTDCVVNGAFYMGAVFNACTKFKAKWNEINGVVDRAFYVSTSADDFEISENLINGYQVSTTTRYTFYAINFLHVAAAGFTNGRVSRNTIKHMAAHCIGFSGRISGVTCAENTIDDCTFHGILAQDIATIKPTDLSIVGNQISGCLGVGLYILNSFYANVVGNGVHNCADAFVLEGGGKHNLGNNIAHDNTGYGYKMAAATTGNAVNSNTSSACLVGVGEIGGALANTVHDHTSLADTTIFGTPGTGSDYSHLRLVIGHTAPLAIAASGTVTPAGQVIGIDAASAAVGYAAFSATPAVSGQVNAYKSANAAIGSATAVALNERIFALNGFGAQQTGTFANQSLGAQMLIEVDAAVTSGASFDMPMRWVFKTAGDAGAGLAEHFRIASNGFVTVTAGSFGTGAPVTKTIDFTVGDGENDLICNKGSTLTVTLPSASAFNGRRITIKTIQAFTVVSNASNVVPKAGGAAATAILAGVAGNWATLVSNGTNWEIMTGT